MADPTFIGSIKKANTNFFLMNGGFTKDDLEKMLSMVNENGYFNFSIKESKKGGYYMQHNDWKPDNAKPVNAGGDDLPY